MTEPCLLPSACHDGIGTPDYIAFAAQIPRLYASLSTLRVLPHGSDPRMTRGQCGSLSFTVTDFHHLPPADLPGAPRLNGWPMHSPADASPTPSRMPTHGSGPTWIATPSS